MFWILDILYCLFLLILCHHCFCFLKIYTEGRASTAEESFLRNKAVFLYLDHLKAD